MRTILLAAAATATLLAGCASDGYDRRAGGYYEYQQYDYNRPDPRYGYYDAGRYYRDDNRRYKEYRMSRNDRLYRGRDGRYYCRRSDGTTGLIVGGVTGGALGAIIAPGDSKALGAIIGAGAGAVIGNEVDRGNVRCR
ncbi:glycine zipper 2TM domain-containing protein [Iodidimonas sp. SYSU 1G8]|uniref:glycine zipper 2TM domain-containing protein n=1 Tax=Iodidimonas sp. SYSU 1G8 TaxID=3133967 RepID=UPI0031FF0908